MSYNRNKYKIILFKNNERVKSFFSSNNKKSILEKYSRQGYRDARIISDKLVWNDDNTISLEIKVEEGKQYYFDDINFVGNKNFTVNQLTRVLGIDKGDIYNGTVLKERVKGDNSPDSQDLQTLYHNNGYLFASVDAVKKLQ